MEPRGRLGGKEIRVGGGPWGLDARGMAGRRRAAAFERAEVLFIRNQFYRKGKKADQQGERGGRLWEPFNCRVRNEGTQPTKNGWTYDQTPRLDEEGLGSRGWSCWDGS